MNIFSIRTEVNIDKFDNLIEVQKDLLREIRCNQLTSSEVDDLIDHLKASQLSNNMWSLDDYKKMPGDARFEYCYIPTCIASAILIHILVNEEQNHKIKAFELLEKSLPRLLRRGFDGHGYDSVRGFLECTSIFASKSTEKFIIEYSKEFSSFRMFWKSVQKKLHSIQLAEDSWIIGQPERDKARNLYNQIKVIKSNERQEGKNVEKLYLAYGSNMNRKQMAERCPEAKFIGKVSLKSYSLNFRKSCSGTYATIDYDKNSSVPAVLWSITAQNEKDLDRYEGINIDGAYYKTTVSIEYKGDIKKALVYILPESKKEGLPQKDYLEIIKVAYLNLGIETGSLPIL